MSEQRVVIVTGASRGIGRAVAQKLSAEGIQVVAWAKTLEEGSHPKLQGSLSELYTSIRESGGQCFVQGVDVRDDVRVASAVTEVLERFGRIDGLVNNAGAIVLASTANTSIKHFDLMHQINLRAPFSVVQACLSALSQSSHAHIVNIAPPFSSNVKWYAPHPAYSLSKMSLSLATLAWAREFAPQHIAVNTLWPKTLIATDAVRVHFPQYLKGSRHPQVVADALSLLLQRDPKTTTGQHFLDEDLLKASGLDDFSSYAFEPGAPLIPDLYVERS